jgi:hypothetical protein
MCESRRVFDMGFAFPRGVCERLVDISGYLHHRLDGDRAANGVDQCPYRDFLRCPQ